MGDLMTRLLFTNVAAIPPENPSGCNTVCKVFSCCCPNKNKRCTRTQAYWDRASRSMCDMRSIRERYLWPFVRPTVAYTVQFACDQLPSLRARRVGLWTSSISCLYSFLLLSVGVLGATEQQTGHLFTLSGTG